MKLLRFLPLLVLPALVQPAHAILDTNSNGISDLFEKQFNNNQLFSPGDPNHQPSADPDADGWSNLLEASAGTNPFNSQSPGGKVIPAIEAQTAPGTFIVSWPTIVGKAYQLQQSETLSGGSWIPVGPTRLGDGQPIEDLLQPQLPGGGATAPKMFYRVLINDYDQDGDGLSNTEEHGLGLNPASMDSDADGLADKAELLAGLDPNNFDSDYDGISDDADTTPLANNAQADPDGENLPSALNDPARLIGRWDFEQYNSTTPSGLASTPASVGSFLIAGTNVSWDGQDNWAHEVRGMPWAAVHFTEYGAYGKLPANRFDDENTQTWAMWIKFPAAALDTATRKRTLFSLGAFTNRSDGTRLPHMHCYFDPSNQTLRMDKYNVAGWAQTPLASWPIPPALDDGQWHHIAIGFSSGSYMFMMDGQNLGTVNNATTVSLQLVQSSSTPYALIGRFTGATPPLNFEETLGASIDRLRIYDKKLTIADETALYQQDIDRDGLPDRIEARRRGWRDANHDNVRDAAETYHIINPFRNQRPTDDSDRDNLADIHEYTVTQTDPADPDSDDDRLPDGWEVMHGLNPLNTISPNTYGDPDGDLVSNFLEYCHGSSPVIANTDGGVLGDKEEIDQGTNPADAGDDDQAPPEGYLYSLTLGIGDQSASHSEDYNLVVYEYDWATNTETERFRLLSGGFGEYSETSLHCFDPAKTYTFKIEWVDSKYAGTSEGPDYDYTLKIEPVEPDQTLELLDSFDVTTQMAETGYQLRGVKSDFPNFLITTETKRVLANSLKIDLAVDNNMDREIESLPDGMQAGQGWLTSKTDDRDLEKNNPLHAVVIDVNNNNTDKGIGSLTKDQVDNRNTQLDTDADKIELTKDTVGHSFGTLRVWASPLNSYGIPWRGGIKEKILRLSLPDQGSDQVVRIFSWHSYGKSPDSPIELLGPGKIIHDFDPVTFFEKTEFIGSPSNWKRDLLVEGLTYGTVRIRLEVIDIVSNQVIASDDTYVAVNVDRCEQPLALVAGNKDARVLAGVSPHHIGAKKSNLGGSGGVRAIRGRLVARPPSIIDDGLGTRHTPMIGRRLRGAETSDDPLTSSSIWIGLKQVDADGSMRWIQTGLLWMQKSDKKQGSMPAAYLESGDFYQGTKARSIIKASAASPTQLGQGVVHTNVPILSNWHLAPVQLDFVLFKKPVAQNADGSDKTQEPWRVIFKDARTGNTSDESLYLLMDQESPNPPDGTTSDITQQLRNRFCNQHFHNLDILFETGNSVSYAPGKDGEHAVLSNLYSAAVLKSTAQSMPSATGSKGALYQWAVSEDNFDWEALPLGSGDIVKEIKSGRSGAAAKPEDGTNTHPTWQIQSTGGSLEIWDTRADGFGAGN